MKIIFIENAPHLIPENQNEEDQLFNWYKKNKNKQVSAVINFEYFKKAETNEKAALNIADVSVLLFDFLYYVRHGTQDTPIKEIKDGIKVFLSNYKR